MTSDLQFMTCQEFQEQMAELIGSGEDVNNHPHLRACATCRALLADLQTIAAAARELLPVEPPAEDLWQRIELAIQKEDSSLDPG